jgi:serine/threonine protein phosphatase PrpC
MIESLPAAWFAKGTAVPAVSTMQVQTNSIKELPANFFTTFNGLTMLDLSENCLASIPAVTGQRLEGLYVGANKLTEIQISEAAQNTLLYLDVSRNQLKELPIFGVDCRLRMLSASYNPLQRLPESIPHGITELHIAGCGLRTLPAYSLPRAVSIFLHNNQLTELPIDLASMQSLRCLDVSLNCFSELPQSFVAATTTASVEIHTKLNPRPMPPPTTSEIGLAGMSGRRQTMEDVVSISEDLLADGSIRFVGLFDGHGGTNVATVASVSVAKYLAEHLPDHLACPEHTRRQLQLALQVVNKQLATGSVLEHLQGSTALLGLFTDGGLVLHVANIGDSRAVLCRGGRAVRLSKDHKPLDVAEYDRIVAAGGWVTAEGRIQNLLSVARALGDKALIPFVSDEAFVASYAIEPSDEFVIFACDGVWDVLSDDMAVRVVHDSLQSSHDAHAAATMLRDWAYLDGSVDNITVVVVPLK